MDIQSSFHQMFFVARQKNIRLGTVIHGAVTWQQQCLSLLQVSTGGRCVQLGGELIEGFDYFPFNKGKAVLGQECQLLVVDLGGDFDANSFNSAVGALCGGGILAFFNASSRAQPDYFFQWLNRALAQLIQIYPDHIEYSSLFNNVAVPSCVDAYSDQARAVEKIIRVAEGRTKRPLVITANRGRGKSSTLGLACAELISHRPCRIAVTSPSIVNVAMLFDHLARQRPDGASERLCFSVGDSLVRFYAPDELVRTEDYFDLVLVDEAAAIPLPILISLTQRFHRIVYSSTINGYEGSGRGFTLKFIPWLESNRPGYSQFIMQIPIRWAPEDPLEQWLSDTFLLNYEDAFNQSDFALDSIEFRFVDKKELFRQPSLLGAVFAILVNAHYQTSPNDLALILNDPATRLFVGFSEKKVACCLLSVDEGPLSDGLINDVMTGKRRPKGQFGPVTFCNQLGLIEPAEQRSIRILRIAVHPVHQRQGLGTRLLSEFCCHSDSPIITTSFGATSELVHFWSSGQFVPIKLGSHRDQASGCYSLFMVRKHNAGWLPVATSQFSEFFQRATGKHFFSLDVSLTRALLRIIPTTFSSAIPCDLLWCYALGGSNYESVSVWFEALIYANLPLKCEVGETTVRKVLHNETWSSVVSHLGFRGRRDAEQRLRVELTQLLTDLQCKSFLSK